MALREFSQTNLSDGTVMNDNVHASIAELAFHLRMSKRLADNDDTRVWRGIRNAALISIPIWLLLAWALGFRL